MKLSKQLTAAFAAVLMCFLFVFSSAAAGADASASHGAGDPQTQDETGEGPEDPADPEGNDPAELPSFCLGDADLNGNVTVEDARLILRAVISLEALPAEGAVYADLDGSGVVDTADARLALRTAIGLEEAVRHTFTEITVTVPATCKSTGSISFCCAECGMAGEVVTPRLPHTFVQNVITPAGCTADGEAERVCSQCGYKTSVSLPATGHEWVSGGKGKPKKCARCGISAECWAEIDGKYRYYDANGEFVKNAIVDGYYVDDTGCRCEDAVIKQAVSYVLNHGGSGTNAQKLRNCYDYIIAKCGYTRLHGFPTAASLPETASAMFNGAYGNCYSFASMFAYIGKVLGYPSRIDSGQMMYSNGDMHYHGWTEFYVDGTWYMCDPVKEKYFYIDGFMRTHEKFPLYHTHGTYFTLYTQNGTAYWE